MHPQFYGTTKSISVSYSISLKSMFFRYIIYFLNSLHIYLELDCLCTRSLFAQSAYSATGRVNCIGGEAWHNVSIQHSNTCKMVRLYLFYLYFPTWQISLRELRTSFYVILQCCNFCKTNCGTNCFLFSYVIRQCLCGEKGPTRAVEYWWPTVKSDKDLKDRGGRFLSNHVNCS